MQKHLAIGRGMKILDQKNREGGGFNEPPPASLRVKGLIYIFTVKIQYKFSNNLLIILCVLEH